MVRERYSTKNDLSKRVVAEFTKASSCSYAMTKVIGEVWGNGASESQLSSVIGFSSGLAIAGDTCGAVNGGIMALKMRVSELPDLELYSMCREFVQVGATSRDNRLWRSSWRRTVSNTVLSL